MPIKPTKHGFKAWCLCYSKNGYIYNISIYTGKVACTDDVDDGLSARVVKSMVGPLYDKGHQMYMGKFFSSVTLANYLLSKKYIHGWDSASVIQRVASTAEGHKTINLLMAAMFK